MAEQSPRDRLLSTATSQYNPVELAEPILEHLESMEHASNARPSCDKYRTLTGLTCAAEFREPASNHRNTENAITGWLAEFFPNALSQKRENRSNKQPDIVFTFLPESNDDEHVLVFLEAKPVWQRWITTGEIEYEGVTTDKFGRSTGNYAGKNIRQVVGDRDKLFEHFIEPNDRHLILALVFQRPGELDDQLVEAVGPGWSHRKRHVLDLCNPPGDNIGMTGMVFWPDSQS